MNKKILVYAFSAVLFVLLMALAWFFYNKYGSAYNDQGGFVKNESGEASEPDVDKSANDSDESENVEGDKAPVLVDENERAADFTVFDAEGNEHTLSQKFGNPIVLNFWATYCGPCKYELPSFEKMYRKYGEEVEFMMINLGDSTEDIEKFMNDNEYTFPVYYDYNYEAASAYNARYIPLTVVIYNNASVFNTRTGAMELEELEYYIESVLEGK